MNKLNDMIGQAAKIAAQAPNAGETLAWHTGRLDRAVADWYDRSIPKDDSCLMVDVPLSAVQTRAAAKLDTTLICMGRPMPDTAQTPAGWSMSQRMPSDLSTPDADLFQRMQAAQSVLALQKAVSMPATKKAWISDASVQTIVAPFLLNTMNGPYRDQALAELNRVLALKGTFQTLVLAADEPLSDTQIACQGHECEVFPLETQISQALLAAGFHGVRFESLLDRPAMIVDGVELRVFGVSAKTGTKGVCLEQGDAAIYLGPWAEIRDDDGHVYPRGVRIAVCAKTAAILEREPYAGSFEIIKAYDRPDLETAELFDCSRDAIRPAAETKGRVALGASLAPGAACSDADCGC